MKIAVDKGILNPNGPPPALTIAGSNNGEVILLLQHEGVRTTVLLSPDEGVGLGQQIIGTAHVIAHEAQKAARVGLTGADGKPIAAPAAAPASVTPIKDAKKPAGKQS